MLKFSIMAAGMVLAGVMGCAQPPTLVERVPVAGPDSRDSRIEYDRPKPLPDQARLYDGARPPATPPPSVVPEKK